MSKFHDIQESFKTLTKHHGFAPLYALWPANAIILCRALEQHRNIFCYILASANKDGSLRTDLWVSPLNQPDSTLESNSSAFQIPVGVSYDEDHEFFSRCEQRILNLIPDIYSISGASSKELNNPSLISTTPTSPKRMSNIRHYLEGIESLKKSSLYADTIEKAAIKIYSSKSTNLSTIIRAIKSMPHSIFDTASPEASAFLQSHRPPPFDTYSILAEYCYIDTAANLALKVPPPNT